GPRHERGAALPGRCAVDVHGADRDHHALRAQHQLPGRWLARRARSQGLAHAPHRGCGALSMALLSVRNLNTRFATDRGVVRAVNGVSFDLEEGEVLGLVGESGSGKSVTALSIMRLVPEPPGKVTADAITLDGTDLLTLSEAEAREIRGARMAMIFQDPM